MEKPISDKIQAKLLELRLKYPTPSPEEEERQLRDGYMREATDVGTPQGGTTSPLLANILLDDLDKELERRGLPFVRYVDDFAVFASHQKPHSGLSVRLGATATALRPVAPAYQQSGATLPQEMTRLLRIRMLDVGVCGRGPVRACS